MSTVTQTDPSALRRFRTLFDGLPRAYGTYAVQGQDERGKRTGKAVTVRSPLTDELFARHLAGEQGIGVVPIRDDGNVVFGAIDIDVYDGLNAATIGARLASESLPLVMCRSKSGGLHAYCFARTPVPAFQMRAKLTEISALLGHGNCEVFPKQSKLEPSEVGGWINLPYCGDTRPALRPDGEQMSLDQFLAYAEDSRVSPEFFAKPLDGTLGDGPPCLNHLIKIGIPAGTRNDTLFQLGVYARRKNPDDWKTQLENYNRGCFSPPLESAEVLNVIKSIDKKTYQYVCTRAPFSSHCDKATCKTRRYGIGATGESFPVLGTLTKFTTTPPRYLWEIDGQRVQLTTDEVLDYRKFARACFERIDKVLPALKDQDWKPHVSKALEQLQIEDAEDASPENQFWEMLDAYCTHNPTDRIEEIVLGRPYTEDGRTYFRLRDLLGFLQSHRFRECSMQEAGAIIRQRGGKVEWKTIREKRTRLWSVPEFQCSKEPLALPEDLGVF